ncbi:MAG: hypothetical protein JWS11_2541 [Cypionkella sp.]|nr:hypothetical protein [Cypionkella sp.]
MLKQFLVKLFVVILGYYNTVYFKPLYMLIIMFDHALDPAMQLGDKPSSEMREVTLALSLMGSR